MTNTPDTPDQVDALDALLDDWEHEVTGTPKHWKKTPEREAIDSKYKAKLSALLVEARRDQIMKDTLAYSTELDTNEYQMLAIRDDLLAELTQKPPQPQGADSHTDIGDTVSGNEADNREEVADE